MKVSRTTQMATYSALGSLTGYYLAKHFGIAPIVGGLTGGLVGTILAQPGETKKIAETIVKS